MSAYEGRDGAQREEDDRYARIMRRQFGVEVDRSDVAPPGEPRGPDEEERFGAHMRRHLPRGPQE